MDLPSVWFVLIAILYAGFFLLEGFDFGAGMLLPFLGRNDSERRAVLETIGPHWDANEVWLITAGGATFAAFPRWYAAMFSGMYPLLVLLLLALIARGAAVEFRSRLPGRSWRAAWDAAVFAGSLAASVILGAVFADLLRGLPIGADGLYAGDGGTPFNAYALLSGLAVAGLFLLHGANFLALKLGGSLGGRARKAARRLWIVALAFTALFLAGTFRETDIRARLGDGSLFPAAAMILSLLGIGWFLLKRRDGWAFAFGSLAAALFPSVFFFALYPRVMVSSLQPAYSLTVDTAAASGYTLQVITVVALIFVPVVIAYQAWSYWVFRRRVTGGPEEEGYE